MISNVRKCPNFLTSTVEGSEGPCTSQCFITSDKAADVTRRNYHCLDNSTDTRRLTTAIRVDKCVVRLYHPCANIIECTYTNLDSTV